MLPLHHPRPSRTNYSGHPTPADQFTGAMCRFGARAASFRSAMGSLIKKRRKRMRKKKHKKLLKKTRWQRRQQGR